MRWTTVILLATLLMAVGLITLSFHPWHEELQEVQEPLSTSLSVSKDIPFAHTFTVNGISLSGEFSGTGFAQVFFVGDGQRKLIVDTRSLPPRFTNACIDSCSLASLQPESFSVRIEGEGQLSLSTAHLLVPPSPIGLALCPDCKTITPVRTPDHSLFLLVILLAISIVGAHFLNHCCKSQFTRTLIISLFIIAFIMLSGVFGVSLLAPTSAFALNAKRAASVFAALGVLTLFIIGAVEVARTHDSESQDIWRALEEAEDEWQKK